jgi:hypothetical protein
LQPGGPYNLTEGCLASLPSTLTHKWQQCKSRTKINKPEFTLGNSSTTLSPACMQEVGSTW